MTEAHYSCHSSEKTSNLFQVMFPDSAIARSFKCGETKSKYLITFGLAPYFSEQLRERVRSSSTGYVLLFDESYNVKNKMKQMDIHVRCWDRDIVKTRYLTSEFIGHARSSDLCDKLESVMSDFNLQKSRLLQLSMDGPAVNWKAYNELHCELKVNCNGGLLHVGSCGLHTVHNAFKKGISATKWQLDSFLSSAFYLFKECPARREDFVNITGSLLFPPKFCNHRWLENASVAKTCIDLLPSLEKFVKAALEKKISLPQSKSFEIVKTGILNTPLLACRLAFFASVARDVEPFLTKYQSDQPLLPYMCTDLQRMIKSLMQRFVKEDVLSECTTPKRLMEVDICDAANYCSLAGTELGFQTKSLIQKSQRTTSVSDRAVTDFRMECRKFLIDTVKHLLEKCPLKYSVVRNMSCLNPQTMGVKESSKGKMKMLLQSLIEVNQLNHDAADDVLKEYQVLLDTTPTAEFDFDPSCQRLDSWFFSVIGGKDIYKNLWAAVQKLLTLSHGQASVERGFSFNKEVLTDNLSQASIKARRVVLDYISDVGGVLNVDLSKKLLVSAGSACGRYNRYLEDQRRLKQTDEQMRKKRKKEEDIECIKKKLKTAEVDARHLLVEADNLSFKAQEQRSFTLVERSNTLHLSAKDKKDDAFRLQGELRKLQAELKSIS